MKIAVVDIDGILWNMADVWYAELIKVNPDCPYPGKTSAWNFHKGYLTDECFQETIDTIHMAQDKYSCFKHANRLTNMLHNAGFRVIIASHRTSKSKEITKRWLENNEIYFDELHTVADKHFLLKDASLFIDDSPASQKYAVKRKVSVISIRYPYNENMKGVLFFDTFSDMLTGVETWLKEFKYKQQTSISITKEEYDYLLERNKKLIALEGSKVKNWENYESIVHKLFE